MRINLGVPEIYPRK
uniref:Uncharacterized protein n=1 Tax=Arundo donax TaxID=35708 RepID=A0A0A9EZD6_ARUDO